MTGGEHWRHGVRCVAAAVVLPVPAVVGCVLAVAMCAMHVKVHARVALERGWRRAHHHVRRGWRKRDACHGPLVLHALPAAHV